VLDTGSVKSYVNSRLVQHENFVQSPSAPFNAVMGDSRPILVNTIVKAKLQLHSVSATVLLHPLPNLLPGIDILLGSDMLTKFNAVLDVSSAVAILTHKGKVVHLPSAHRLTPCGVVTTQHLHTQPQLLTAKQAAKSL
jgi:hypothetical protein